MKFSNETIATVVIIILLVLLGSFLYTPLFENPGMIFKEAPLIKNKELQLLPGEIYVYAYVFNGTQINMTYSVSDGGNCTRIRVLESVNLSQTCLDKWGMDTQRYNATLENQQIIFFKPWMLALKDGWKWKNAMYIDYNGAPYPVSTSEYRVMRLEEYMNRSVFVVEIKSDGGVEYDWVDADKRIILKMIGPGYEINLVNETNVPQ
ncbi:MAG: hypothetical protein ABH842_02765 [Candidatus Micrarchaeota archaeon]